jgi:PAS domain S-box-containing protein
MQVSYDQSIIFAEQLKEQLTQRKRAEEVLRQSEQKYRALFEESPISLWEEDFSDIRTYIDSLRRQGIKDLREYFESHPDDVVKCASMARIVDVNKHTLELFKAESKEQFVGSLSKVFREESYDMFREELIAIAEGRTAFEEEIITRTLEGDRIHVGVRFSVAPGHEKTLSKVLVSVMDITERKRAEKELKRRHHALEAIHSILFRVTKEYNLNGMGEVLHDIMKEFYPGADTLIFLLGPRRETFYFPRPERGRVKETRFDRAKNRINNPKLGDDLLRLLTTERIEPARCGRKADCPPVLQDLATGFASWMIVPIEVEDVCYGLFLVGSPSTEAWVEHDLVFVESLIRQISGVIRYQISKEAREEAFRNQLAGPER